MSSTKSKYNLVLRLYIAGGGPNSVAARTNLAALCNKVVNRDTYELEVIDVFEQPDRAFEDGIIVTPTLIRLVPEPVLRITGNLSNTPLVISALGLDTEQ